MIMVITKALFCHGIRQLAVRQRCLLQAGIHTGLIQRQRIEGGEHTDIGQDGYIILPVAVTVRRHIHHQRNMEIGSAVHDRLRILCHTAVEILCCRITTAMDCVEVTGTDTASTAQAFVMINMHLMGSLVVYQSLIGTFSHASFAATAQILIDLRFALSVLFHFTGSGSAAHTDIFDSTAEARRFMPLEMIQGNKHIRIHNGPADLSIFHIFAALYRHLDIIRSLQTITNDHRTPNRQRCETILPGTVHMLDGILTAAGIQGITVRQERNSAQLLYHIRYRLGIIGT